MKRIVMGVASVLTVFALVMVAGAAFSQAPAQKGPQSASEVEFRLEMQHMWEKHVYLLDMLSTYVIYDLPGQSVILKKGMADIKNMTDFLATYYGNESMDQLCKLLQSHEQCAYEYMKAAKAGDESAMKAAMAEQAEIATKIGQCLESVNPAWPCNDVEEMFIMHSQDVAKIVDCKCANDTAGALKALDVALEHARAIADVMTTGCVTQFPKQFKD